MFSTLAVVYLFLGGAGAGAMVTASLADLLLVKQPFGLVAGGDVHHLSPVGRVVAFTFAVGFAMLVAGVACLMADLGRIDRVVSLFLRPSFTYLTVGAYALALLLLVSLVPVAARLLYLPAVRRGAVVACEGAAVVLGLVVMVYTGLLLQGTVGVAFWRTPLVSALFVLSSLSCGLAVMLFVAARVEHDAATFRLAQLASRTDLVVLVAEAVCAAAFVATTLQAVNPGAASSAVQLFWGGDAAMWWLGFIACGIALPLTGELAFMRTTQNDALVLMAVAVLVCVGGFCMRSGIVDAGQHRALELQMPQEQLVSDAKVSGATLQTASASTFNNQAIQRSAAMLGNGAQAAKQGITEKD